MASYKTRKNSKSLNVNSLEKVPYSEIENLIKPLDLLLFRGGDFVSGAIRYLQNKMLGNGTFSHVGIVVTRELMPWLKVLEPGEKYVWESTMSIPIGNMVDGVPDIESGKGKFGVQIRSLRDVVESYTNEKSGALVSWGALNNNPWKQTENHKQIKKIVRRLHREVGCKTYELNFLELAASLFPFLRKFRNKAEWIEDVGYGILRSFKIVEDNGGDAFYFCTELVAYILQELGVISSHIKPNEVVPMDFLGYDREGMESLVDNDPVILVP